MSRRIIPEQNAPMSKGLRTSLVNSENSRVKLDQVPVKNQCYVLCRRDKFSLSLATIFVADR